MSDVMSIWSAKAANQLADLAEEPVYVFAIHEFEFAVHLLANAVWIAVTGNDKGKVIFRTAYAPDGLTLTEIAKENGGVRLKLHADIGDYSVAVMFPEEGRPLLHYKVTFVPRQEYAIPFWPKDIVIPETASSPDKPQGEIYISQIGLRSGIIYAGMKQPCAGSFLYLQDLTSLSAYCEITKTSAGDTVNGEWPEFGFSLPASIDTPLPAGKEVVISDAWVSFSKHLPGDQFEIAKQFLSHLSLIYLYIPRPEIKRHDYLDILARSLKSIETAATCWLHHDGHAYIRAYVGDDKTPPEIMVQLAVLVPVLEYTQWSGQPVSFMPEIRNNLPTFWDDKLKIIRRWLPALEHMLDGSEEQKKPEVMDSWYLYHPLLNFARMGLDGDEGAGKIFLDSLDYAMKVARRFNYRWPVFYDMETLEVVKEEAEPGKGGEKDVAGIYTQVMLLAWEMTKEEKYLDEAKTAAASLQEYGFDIFYQANTTAFSAKAMLQLFRITQDDLYLNLAYLCVANLFKNMALWQCNYGYGKNFPLFFALFPLNNAPYTAVYEEQEVFAAIDEFLSQAEGLELQPGVGLLLAEFVRHMISRAAYYYPAMLPPDMISEEVKTGHIDRDLWVALEDLSAGWEKSGTVGQEVYGAGLAFGILPRHGIRVEGEKFMVFVEYPFTAKQQRDRQIQFTILGDKRLSCAMHIINQDVHPPTLTVRAGDTEITADDSGKYTINGDQQVIITW
jgi:hypothetical protein